MTVYDRFLRYIKIKTTSDPNSTTTPSTEVQLDLARVLSEELKAMGAEDVRISETGYVYGVIPATDEHENQPALGLIAHMDTSPDFSGEGVNPRLIPNYDGGDVVLGNSGRTLNTEQFPHLVSLKGKTLIVTDGTTLLGADDKAGIAEIMTACEKVLTEKIPHGKICIGFTPDEEIGRGADAFDVKEFGADYAFTVDGGFVGELNYENFNASSAQFTINGFNIHPGSAKNKMINALLVACEINGMLPAGETPRDTEGREGFFHLVRLNGSEEKAVIAWIIRDHSKAYMEARKEVLRHIEKLINEKYGAGTAVLEINDQYENMESVIQKYPFLLEMTENAMREAGVVPQYVAIRGGTDGARLSFMGLPCPNLCTGGYAYHGPYEHATVEGLESCSKIITALIQQFTNFKG